MIYFLFFIFIIEVILAIFKCHYIIRLFNFYCFVSTIFLFLGLWLQSFPPIFSEKVRAAFISSWTFLLGFLILWYWLENRFSVDYWKLTWVNAKIRSVATILIYYGLDQIDVINTGWWLVFSFLDCVSDFSHDHSLHFIISRMW